MTRSTQEPPTGGRHGWIVLGTLGLLLLLPFLSPTSVGAQEETGRVEGRIVAEDSGAPIPGVEVTIEGIDARAVSNAQGYYVFRSLPEGSAALQFRRLGYEPANENVEVLAGSRVAANTALDPSPVGLDPVLVQSRRTRMVGDPLTLNAIPGSAHFLTRQDLEAQKLPHDNVHEMLRRIPGVNVQEEEGYGLRPNIGLRGTGVSRSSKITLMEDGVLIAPAPYAAPAAYYFPTAGRMEGIEVRKGSSQIRYGPRTIGGAINFLSSSIPDRQSWELDTQGGEDRTLRIRARAGDSGEHFGWMAETYQLRTDGYKQLQGGGDTGFRLSDYTVKLRANTSRDADTYQELELKLGYHDELSDETYLGLTHEDFQANALQRYAASRNDAMDTEHQQLQLRHFIQPGDRVDVTTTAYHNGFARNWYKLNTVSGAGIGSVLDDPDAYADELAILRGADSDVDDINIRANNREYTSQGIQSVLGLRLGSEGLRHDVEIGLRYHRDEEDRFQWDDGYQMVGGVPVLTSEGVPGTQANRIGDARAFSAYIQDEIGIGERWTVVPGVRFESIDLRRRDYPTDPPSRNAPDQVRETSVSAITPGVGAVYALDPSTHLFGGIHKGFSPPGPGVAEETDPEESINYEIGARVRRAGLGFEIAGFFSDYRNVLGQETLATGGAGVGDMFNGGAVHTAGVETSLDYDLSWAGNLPVRLPLRVSYTYTQATFQGAFESDFGPWGTVEEGDHLPYLPAHQFSGSVGVEDASWKLTFVASGATEMRTQAGNGPIPDQEATDGFVVFNLQGEYVIPGAFNGTLYGGVQNLADQHYVVARRPAGARPGMPRTLFAGIRFSH